MSVVSWVRFALVATVCGFAATVLLPAADPAVRAARAATAAPQVSAGRWVYAREGCAACHTQQVRVVEGRFGMVREPQDIGQASTPAQYVGQNPALPGDLRLGPDLSHVASRIRSAEEFRQLLRSGRGGMPPYPYLSDRDLDALVAYLLTLR
jgi:cbb3-type cytochrome oxidase cytochrome c subunit